MTAPSQAQPDQSFGLFSNVFHQVEAALLVLDEAGIITLSNPAAERLLGIAGDVLCGHHISTVLLCEAKAMASGGLQPECSSQARDLLALFDAGLMPGHGLPREWVVADKDGSRHMVSISASPLAQGNATGHVLVIQDLTEMKRMQQLLHRQHALFANGPMVAFSCSPSKPHEVQEVSPNVAEILGYFPEDILLDPLWWQQRLHPDDQAALADGRWRLAQSEGFATCRYRFLHGSGRWCWLEEHVQLLPDDVVQGYWIDVSKQVEGEDRLAKIASNIPGMLFKYTINPYGAGHFVYVSDGVRNLFGISPQQARDNAELVAQRIFPDDLQRLLEDSEAHFRMLFQNHGAVMILIDPDQGCIVDANPSAERFYGYSHQELVGMPLGRINQMAEERIHGTIGVALLQAHNHFTFTHRLASGELRTVDVHSSPVDSGGRTLLFSIIHDITARREAEEALATLQRQLLAIIEHFHGAMLLEDQSGEVVLVNHQYCEMFMPDMTPEQLKKDNRLRVAARAASCFAQPQLLLQRMEELQQTRQVVLGEEWALKDGRMLERDHVPIYVEGRLRSVLWVYRDITSRKQQEETLRQLATTDALTGIANRRSFMEKLADEFARFQRFSNPVAVLMLDIDHFKRVNDTWGHAVGDKVLHDFAAICQQVVRKVDVVGRLGGEEFAVLLPGCGMAGALALAERLREAVRSHVIQVGEASLQVRTSIGVSSFARSQQDASVALALADQALYEAKLAGRDQVRAFDGNGQHFPPSN